MRLRISMFLVVLLAGCGGEEPAPSGPADSGAVPAGDQSEKTGGISIAGRQMVLVPAGEFTMGSNTGAPDEQPARTVFLDAFYLDQYEVTVLQYRACVGAGACEEPMIANLCNWDGAVPDIHPINCMTWLNAKAYCEWAGLRLPTEAEWEKAARGTDGRTYPWGGELSHDRANYREGAGRSTAPVGSYPEGVSPYGAYDLAGNVWEWTADWYEEGYYAEGPRENPQGPERGERRVLRGGSWWFEAPSQRSALRHPYHPLLTDVDIGLRCARSF